MAHLPLSLMNRLTKTESAVFKLWMLYFQRISFQIIESVTEMCTLENACDKYKLFIPEDNYGTPQQESYIDAFERRLLKQAKAYIHISYSNTSNRIKVLAQSSCFGKILDVNPAMAEMLSNIR